MTTTINANHNIKLNSEDFIKSLTIEQRYDFFAKNEEILNLKYQEDAYKNWMDRKSILKDEHYENMFKSKKIKHVPYSNAIKEDIDAYTGLLKDIVEEEEWFQVLNNILSLASELKDEYNAELGYGHLVMPFIQYAQNKIEPVLKSIDYTSKNLHSQIYISLINRLLKIALKSFVLELNISKLKDELTGESPEKRFESFIRLKSEPKELVAFYSEYAVLSKILVRETVQFINNVIQVFENIDAEFENLKVLLSENEIMFKSISFGEGDTHQQGKEVIIFPLDNNKKLVYKPKKLQVIHAYNSLISRINQEQTILDLKLINALVRENFAFEVFIEQRSCNNLQEVENYYKRFGQIIAVMYMINGNDLHMENLIAHGEYPCIVDIETIFQNNLPYDIPYDADLIGKYKTASYVNSTLLLPEKIVHNEKGDVIEMSALSGDKQVLSKKVYKPKMVNTDEMKYELDNLRINSSNNQVFLDEKVVDYKNYIPHIIEGFSNTMDFFINNKEELLKEDGLISAFENLTVRIILRNTYSYAQLLDNLHHPDYMRDYYYHEQIIENLWAHIIDNKLLINSEYQDMLNGDIPIFFTNTSTCDVYDSYNNKFSELLKESGISRVKKKIEGINTDEIAKQITIIKLKLGEFSPLENKKYQLVQRPNSLDENLKEILLKEVISIADELAAQAIIDEKSKTMTWITINHDEKKYRDIGTAQGNLYFGLAGVSLFYHYLFKETKNTVYKKYRDYCLNMSLKTAKFSLYNSGLLGFSSLIYPATKILKSEPNRKCKQIIQETIDFIDSDFLSNLTDIDWLHGKSSVIEMLLLAYDVNYDESYLQLATSYAQEIMKSEELKSLELGGLAHGYSGIASSLLKLGYKVENEEIIEVANKILDLDKDLYNKDLNGWVDQRDEKHDVKHYWCHGTVGIGMSRLNMLNIVPNHNKALEDIELSIQALSNITCLNDDSLCHGNMGLADYYVALHQYKQDEVFYQKAVELVISAIKNKQENGRYNLNEYNGFPPISLYRGLPGIGYAILRVLNPEQVSSVLMFD